MDTHHRQREIIGTGIPGLTTCVFLAVVNAFVFTVSNGRNGHPTAQIGDWGIVGNLIAMIGAWIVFTRGKRGGLLQSLVAITLLTIVHYFLISNIWTIIAHRT